MIGSCVWLSFILCVSFQTAALCPLFLAARPLPSCGIILSFLLSSSGLVSAEVSMRFWNAKRSFSEFGHKCAHNAQTVHLPSPRKINAHLNGGMKAYHFDETALNTRLALSERVIYLVFSDRILSSVVITQLKLDPSNRLRLISTRTPQP